MIRETISRWSAHEAPRLGAALTFYTILSLAPLLVIAVSIAGLVFGTTSAEQHVLTQAHGLIGEQGTDAIRTMMQNTQRPAAGSIAGLIGLATLLFGASGVFAELRSALNKIWEVDPRKSSGLTEWLKDRIFTFGMVLALGFLLLVSLIASAIFGAVGKVMTSWLPLPEAVLQFLTSLITLAGITVLFALMLKYVPEIRIDWRLVLPGAFGTAVLFEIGRILIGLYLGKASVGSAYGAAGSLVVVIVWLYYSSQIFYFGAEFTRVWAGAHGWQPERKPESAAAQPVRDGAVPAPAAMHVANPPHGAPRPQRGLALAAGALGALAIMAFRKTGRKRPD